MKTDHPLSVACKLARFLYRDSQSVKDELESCAARASKMLQEFYDRKPEGLREFPELAIWEIEALKQFNGEPRHYTVASPNPGVASKAVSNLVVKGFLRKAGEAGERGKGLYVRA